MKLPILNSEHSCDNIFFFPAKAETDLVVSAPDLVELPPSQLYSDPTGTQVWVLAPHPRTGTHLLSHGFLVWKVEKVTPPDFYEHLVYVKRWALGTWESLVPVLTGRGKWQPQSVLECCKLENVFYIIELVKNPKKHILQPVKNYVKFQF